MLVEACFARDASSLSTFILLNGTPICKCSFYTLKRKFILLNITDTVSNITEFAELFGEVFMV